MRTVDAWTLAQEIFGRGATPQQVHLAYTFIVAARGTFVGYNNNWDEEYSVDEVVLALKAADMTSDIIRGSDRMLVKGNPSQRQSKRRGSGQRHAAQYQSVSSGTDCL